MGQLIKLAWRNMWRNWRRTAIAMVAIILGVILLLFFDGVLKGSDQALFSNAVRLYGGNIQVHAPGFKEKMHQMPMLPLENTNAVVQAAGDHPLVTVAAKRINTAGLISSKEGAYPVTITGIEPTLEAPISLYAENIGEGRFLLDDEGDAIVIGKGLADMLGVDVTDRVTLLGRSKKETMRQRTMTIVGIYDLGVTEAEKQAVFVTLPEAQSLYNLRNAETEVAVSLKSIGQEKEVVTALKTALPTYEIDSWETLRPELRETMQTKLAFSSFFGLFVIIIASIGILNIQLMAVFERTREMGVLAALGMKGRQITTLFLIEGTLIGVVGAVIGSVVAMGLLAWIGSVGIDLSMMSDMGEISALMGSRLYPFVPPATYLNRGITVAIITALASIYPAWQASRKEPAEALHHV